MKITIIGDIHGNRKDYLELIKDTEYSIQIGDLDFNYDWNKTNKKNKRNQQSEPMVMAM